jgi:hypothetical protein
METNTKALVKELCRLVALAGTTSTSERHMLIFKLFVCLAVLNDALARALSLSQNGGRVAVLVNSIFEISQAADKYSRGQGITHRRFGGRGVNQVSSSYVYG